MRRCDGFSCGEDVAPTIDGFTCGDAEYDSGMGLEDSLGCALQDQAGEFAGDVGTGIEAYSVCLEIGFVGYGVAVNDDLFVWLSTGEEVFSYP